MLMTVHYIQYLIKSGVVQVQPLPQLGFKNPGKKKKVGHFIMKWII